MIALGLLLALFTHLPSAQPVTTNYQLVFRQTVPYMYAQDELRLNAEDPTSDNYAILDELERFRREDGRLYFRMVWPGDDTVYEWSQTSNPVFESVEGYEAINVPFTGKYWGGLEPSTAALMDGSVSHSNWFYAIGSHGLWQGGIPSYAKSDSDNAYPQQAVELYVAGDNTLQCGSSVSGSTRGRPSQVGNPSGEVAYEFTAESSMIITFDLCDSGFDTYIRIIDDSGNEVARNDDHRGRCGSRGSGVTSHVQTIVQAGRTYTVVVEGFADSEGDFQLDVTCIIQPTLSPPVIDETCSTCRIRRNWNGMDDDERRTYINTVNIARRDEPYKSQYDALVMSHGILPFLEIHGQVQFLAWHRWFIFEYENILRQITPCITVPYWAWEVAGDNWHQDEIWGPADHQFGSCGQGVVNDGPFSDMIFPGTHAPLSRNCDARSLPKISDLDRILEQSPDNFESFFNDMDRGPHSIVHRYIGGSMGNGEFAGMTPEFFLHHNNVDKIWTNWQLRSESHELAQSSRDATLSGTSSTYTVDDFTRTRNQAGICVEYEDHIGDTSERRRLNTRFTKVNLAVAISNQLPKDVAFRDLLVHTNELSLQASEDFEAEQLIFAANQRGDSLSDERAHEIAHLHQENTNWGKYIKERKVDTEYVPDSEAKAFFTDIVGITAESVRHALETTHKLEALQAFDRQWTEFEQLFSEN